MFTFYIENHKPFGELSFFTSRGAGGNEGGSSQNN